MLTISKGIFSCDPNTESLYEVTINNITDLIRKRYHIISSKILLLPISALIQPLPDGTFPIIELLKIADCYSFYQKDIQHCKFSEMGVYSYDEAGNEISFFEYVPTEHMFLLKYKKEYRIIHNQLGLFEYLYSIHADHLNLIPAGLAIDKRTVV
jgi:hypothetical protein